MSKTREYLEAFLIAVILLKFANTFVLQTFYIPSGSMEETLLIGDHLFVNRFIYGPKLIDLEEKIFPLRPIRRGDVVVFRSKEDHLTDVVKRCVGLPGDTIEIRADKLLINGAVVDDSAVTKFKEPMEMARLSRADRRMLTHKRAFFGPIRVPEAHYFCMGDNRWNSRDSRFWGTLPAHLVKGRASVIYWSYGGETPDGQYHGLANRLRQLASTAFGFLTKSRWGRTFRLVR